MCDSTPGSHGALLFGATQSSYSNRKLMGRCITLQTKSRQYWHFDSRPFPHKWRESSELGIGQIRTSSSQDGLACKSLSMSQKINNGHAHQWESLTCPRAWWPFASAAFWHYYLSLVDRGTMRNDVQGACLNKCRNHHPWTINTLEQQYPSHDEVRYPDRSCGKSTNNIHKVFLERN